ncbi:MAG: hypothetical protein IMF26_04360 [Candidatus Fermentithermobacillus carboniphilus]|uniref:Restriction endonuclease type IV Mrr domain-containing protein n=1 Tax=Candidatus Fermentithermobacillus carboniphilus TaxID=3085328 RepID=A0AAT9LE68_9FIRM|nr:MAG: hypothetical protein IMF26_04360 [Candidatus Fermentithermobacillus carboniphilus]
MIPLNAPELKRIAGFLHKYDLKSTVTQLGGLLTAPALQADTIRIETIVHLAVAHCHGYRKPSLAEIDRWLNRYIGNIWIALLEDPVEDVFVTNVETPEGNRRVFEGIWESNDYFVQIVLETLNSPGAPPECRALLLPAFALLKLSDCVAERAGLRRWHTEPSIPQDTVKLALGAPVADGARWITFTAAELDALGINRKVLEPFILRDEHKKVLAEEWVGHSSLERRPLVDFGDELVLALPHAVSPAIRRFVVFELKRLGYLHEFADTLASLQARQVEREGLWELKGEAESLEPPKPDGKVPSLHTWLLKYDVNKYLHVVLLHDRLDWLDTQGLSSFMEYPEELRAGLEQYLSKVSSHCRSLPDFAEGMTLLVMGGLGRGFVLEFKDWPEEWRLSVIRIPDLLMLAREPDRPITRYLKCIKQKEWAEEKGVRFVNTNGDYNFYCFWRHLNYQLVPRDVPVDQGTVLVIGNDMVLPVRAEVRNLADCHVLETVGGIYLPVMRFGRDAYFKSMQGRPIYASLHHLGMGVLAGAVETPRGPSWLVVEPRDGGEEVRRFLYEMWSGFIGLYDRLVFEVEARYPKAPRGAIEIRLNFGEVAVPEDLKYEPGVLVGEPEVTVNLVRRTAEVRFPSDFLMCFQQPENTGERLVLRGIAKALVSLHQGATGDVDESVLTDLMSRVIGDPGERVFHVFRTYDPIEYLLWRSDQKPIFLAHEDFVFSKLRLSEGCTAAWPGTSIKSKSECNQFLHRLVVKIWSQLRNLLHQFDRASVIREVLRVHEAVIQDRDHWRRTAQAVLALYKPEEDVFAVAQERESQRGNVSLAARTVLEMAICECPKVGGRELSRWDLDELLAKAALLIEVATDSDAIYNDLVEPQIELHPNGEYTIDRGFHSTVIKPFSTAYLREEFERAAAEYAKLYRSEPPGGRVRADEVLSADFIRAFRIEFSLTPDEAIDGLAALMDLAVERDSVVVETTLGDLKTRLTVARGLSPDACEAFIRTFSIFHRPAWDKSPPGFSERDIYPWRFRRRLSLAARPILIFGNEDDDRVFYGAGTLMSGVRFLLERSERGHLPQEFFTSQAMKQYIGMVNNERGRAFALSVADRLREKGWQTRTEVPMTELEGPAELGDVDVLAWRPSGEVLLIECKRLQLARTVAEVAEICRRFRGEAMDELDKHVRRVNWIRANPVSLCRIVGFVPDPARIDDRLVTNTHVPVMYLTSLPIEADKIGPLKE